MKTNVNIWHIIGALVVVFCIVSVLFFCLNVGKTIYYRIMESKASCMPRFSYSFSDNADESFRQATSEAVAMWEKGIGDERLFEYKKRSKNKIGYGDLSEERWRGVAYKKERENGAVVGFEIMIHYEVKDYELLRAILTHELGHALGIGHSYDCRSIMYRYVDRNSYIMKSDIDYFWSNVRVCEKHENNY